MARWGTSREGTAHHAVRLVILVVVALSIPSSRSTLTGALAETGSGSYLYRANYTDDNCSQLREADLSWWSPASGACYTEEGVDYVEHGNCSRTSFASSDASCSGDGTMVPAYAMPCTLVASGTWSTSNCTADKASIQGTLFVDHTLPLPVQPLTVSSGLEMSVDLVGIFFNLMGMPQGNGPPAADASQNATLPAAMNATAFIRGLVLGMSDTDKAFVTSVSVSEVHRITTRRRNLLRRRALAEDQGTSSSAVGAGNDVGTRVEVMVGATNEATAGILSRYFQTRVASGRLTSDIVDSANIEQAARNTTRIDSLAVEVGIAQMAIVSPAGSLQISQSLLPRGTVTITGAVTPRTSNFTTPDETDGRVCSNVIPEEFANSCFFCENPQSSVVDTNSQCYTVTYTVTDIGVLDPNAASKGAPSAGSVLSTGLSYSDKVHGLSVGEWVAILGSCIVVVMCAIVGLCFFPHGEKKEVVDRSDFFALNNTAADDFYTMNPLHNAIAL